MELKFTVMNGFFDRRKVISALEKGKRAALSKAGAFVMRRARSSIRVRRKPSKPGSPPSHHSEKGSLSLKTIWFYYDDRRDSVVVGPIKFNQKISAVQPSLTLPSLMEYGGTATISEYRWVVDATGWNSKWRRINMRRKPRTDNPRLRLETRNRKATYPARPFMAPALAAEAPNFPDLFLNSVKG
jgi:hypothetical protein